MYRVSHSFPLFFQQPWIEIGRMVIEYQEQLFNKNKLFEVNNEFRHLYYYNKIETMPSGKSEIKRIWKIKI